LKVIDSSALCAVLFGEPEGEAVIDRVGGEPLAAPTLLAYEVATTCWKKLKRHPNQRAQLLAAHSLLARVQVKQVEIDAHQVVLLAERTGLTAYDAAYLWLARALDAELISLDARVLAAAKQPSPLNPE
jgi:predicted nucleic acid-binding protein